MPLRRGTTNMHTKDLVYLGLIALSGIVFYLHGFHAGLARGRKVLDTILSPSGAFTDLPSSEEPAPPPIHGHRAALFRMPVFSKSVHALFGNN